MSIGPDRTALILIDVIADFFAPGAQNHYPRSLEVLPAIRALLDRAREGDRLVVHAVERHRPGIDDHEWRRLAPHAYIGSPEAAYVEGFEPDPDRAREIEVPKRRYSAFFATDLALTLDEQDIRRVILVGVKTNVCLRATAQDAFAHGFDVVVPRDATNSNRPALEAAAMEDLGRYFGDVVDLTTALGML